MRLITNIEQIEYVASFTSGEAVNSDNLIVTYDVDVVNNICDAALDIINKGTAEKHFIIDGTSIYVKPVISPDGVDDCYLLMDNNDKSNNYNFNNHDDLDNLLGGNKFDILKFGSLVLHNHPTNFIHSIKFQNTKVTKDTPVKISCVDFHCIKYSINGYTPNITNTYGGRANGRNNYRPIDKDSEAIKHLESLDHSRMDDIYTNEININNIKCEMVFGCSFEFLLPHGKMGSIYGGLFNMRIDLSNYINSVNTISNDDGRLYIKSILTNLLFDGLDTLTPSKPQVEIVYEAEDGSGYNINTNPFATLPLQFPVSTDVSTQPIHTISSGLISVQPVPTPSGLLFYMDYVYGLSDKDKIELLNRFKLELLYDDMIERSV